MAKEKTHIVGMKYRVNTKTTINGYKHDIGDILVARIISPSTIQYSINRGRILFSIPVGQLNKLIDDRVLEVK